MTLLSLWSPRLGESSWTTGTTGTGFSQLAGTVPYGSSAQESTRNLSRSITRLFVQVETVDSSILANREYPDIEFLDEWCFSPPSG
jgi:hypothetical protein